MRLLPRARRRAQRGAGLGDDRPRARSPTPRCCAASTASPPRSSASPGRHVGRRSDHVPADAPLPRAGGRRRSPQDPQAFAALAGDVEQLLLTEPELRAFVDVGTLANAQLTVVFARRRRSGTSAALEAALRGPPGTRTRRRRIRPSRGADDARGGRVAPPGEGRREPRARRSPRASRSPPRSSSSSSCSCSAAPRRGSWR